MPRNTAKTSGAVSVLITNTVVVGNNIGRRLLVIVNTGANAVDLMFNTTDGTSAPTAVAASGLRLNSGGGSITLTGQDYSGPINGIATGGTSVVTVLELQLAHADTYGAAVFADTPFSWFRLDETSGTSAADEMGGAAGTHSAGVIVNQSPLIPVGFGKGAQYASGFASQTSTTTMSTFGSGIASTSYEFWVKTTSSAFENVFGTVVTATSTILSCGTNALGDGLSVGSVGLYIRKDGVNSLGAGTGNIGINDGNAHHVVFVVTSGTTIDCWVDGVQKSVSYTFQFDISTPANFDFAMMLGARNVRGTPDRFFNGTLDEVAFYNTRLSGARIQAHYAAAQAPASPSSGVVGRKRVDQPGVYGAGRRR